jgi:glycosidase
MSGSFAATVGNGRILARIGRDGSVISLATPHLDKQLIEARIHGVLESVTGNRSLSGKSWKHKLDYLRGTNVLRVISTHSTAGIIERRLVAIEESLRFAYRAAGNVTVGWDGDLKDVLPQAGIRVDGAWPDEFDPPPLGGATRASVVARVPGLADRAAVTDLYARSILVIAQHHDRSGAFVGSLEDGVVLAHALDACGERGAALAFFEGTGIQRDASFPPAPEAGTTAMLWKTWHDAVSGHRIDAVAGLHKAVLKRSSLGLFLTSGSVDLLAHAYLLLTIQSLIPAVAGGDDGFFEHEATVQRVRHSRALYGGAFHAGMPEAREPVLQVEVRPDLDVTSVTVEVAGRTPEQLEPVPSKRGHPIRWSGPVPPAEPGEVSRYKIRLHVSDPDATPVWASDSDPRPGGQEFAFEADAPPPPEWVRDALCYHVMVDRFARPGESLPEPGDPTVLYGGTLDGVRENLDHIAGLGCNVLWLSPVHASPSHHGYDHEDFLTVEPRYGGDAALIRLVEAAHERGMRVLLDFVPNHTGRGHHLFRDAIANGGDAASYYRFWQWPHYYRCFFDVVSLPELDTGSPHVQQHLVRAAQHWLTAYGVDGLRCDHVAGVDPAFWVELRRGLREVKPDALVLGEATGTAEWLPRYAGRLDAIFDFDLAYYVRQALARGRMDAAAFATWLDQHERAYPGLALATLLDNHDMNRFLWMAGGSLYRLKLAATLLLTLPGMPVIYYGTEVGLSQRYDSVIENAEARLPMLWGADQDQDLLAHFQHMGRMRAESIALRRGAMRTVLADREVFVYERRADEESVTVALNFSESTQHREVDGLTIELGPLGSEVKPNIQLPALR